MSSPPTICSPQFVEWKEGVIISVWPTYRVTTPSFTEERLAIEYGNNMNKENIPNFWVKDYEGGFHGAQFTVGWQTFGIGPQDYEDEESARWMLEQFKTAFFRANVQVEGGEA
jgi:hypothetical protein